MKRVHTSRLLAVMIAALAINACSDGTSPDVVRPGTGDEVARGSRGPAPAGTFTSIDFPGATATLLFAINDAGIGVGRYVIAGRTHGLLRASGGELTTIDFPGSGFTVAGGINNDGDIVGWYTLPATSAIRHGFLLRDGEFTSFDPPGSTFTNVLGINDRGDIVGRFCTRTVCREPGSGDFHGFVMRDGEFTILDVPGSSETNAWKVNNRGEILGSFGTTATGVGMFLDRKGDFLTFGLPIGGALAADNGGINARGDVVGKYCDASPCLIGPAGHGFAITDGQITIIDVPGALGTSAYGINARRDIVGGYFDASRVLHAYVMHLGS